MSLDITLTVRLKDEDGKSYDRVVYDGNITNNLKKMAKAVGLYEPIWMPHKHQNQIIKAKDIIAQVSAGYLALKNTPALNELNSPNGWGTYDQFCEFVSEYLHTLKEHPNAEVSTNE